MPAKKPPRPVVPDKIQRAISKAGNIIADAGCTDLVILFTMPGGHPAVSSLKSPGDVRRIIAATDSWMPRDPKAN